MRKIDVVMEIWKEEHEFILPNEYNKHLMKEIEKLLVHVKEGEVVNYKGFDYMVKTIENL
ncbi:hypothetical protein [Bacillus mycoides]|uniref:hypothetical protein n=1 Tax=Bacillus mycoides TaxID=1405 RepID=UPI001C01E986|nr:hypothetical protein [Bacillus mycoides]MCQ6532282.1 hypothetical protein [Bacillus mycoides]QWI54490.1 hypothetical protein EXW42_10125 [Bacillus mycoides]QWI91107.1 hypothetical protein J5W00_06355 [Bacillus mycoides]